MSAPVYLAVWVFSVVLGGLFSALTQSLRDVARPKMDDLMEKRGDASVRARVEKILEDMEGHATAVALPRVVLNLITVVAMVMWLTKVRNLSDPTWIEGLLGVAVTSVLVWVAGVAIPAAVARHAAEVTVATYSGLIRMSYVLTSPLLALSRGVDYVVRRMSGRTKVDTKEELQEEILHVVEEARQEGQFDEFERDMIEAVVGFRDRTVSQIMTPRTQVEALPVTANLGQVVATIRKTGHSRIPVFEGTLDHTLGVFYIKDLMKWLAGERTRNAQVFDLRHMLRPAVYVPDTKTVRELLEEMLAKRIHIAIVADEFGGTAGIVTLEDIFEEVFGDIQDEYEQPAPSTGQVRIDAPQRSAEIDARAYIEDVNPELEAIGVQIPESEDYDTVGGFVTVTTGRIPRAGDEFRHAEQFEFKVLEAEPTRVLRIKLRATVPAAPEADGMARPEGAKATPA